MMRLFLLNLPLLCAAVDPLVALDYASYRGVANAGTGVTQWLGIRFAAPPTGDLRFAAPQDPPKASGVQEATSHGPICLATRGGAPDSGTSEDCLFLDVYAPSDAKNLPVYVFLQGGGFNLLGNANYNGTGMIAASGGNIVVVTLNYRVGPYGFLASKEVEKGASLNNGMKDQRKALQWVQKYISQFGGNPKHVVIGGDSAGGTSIALHLTAYGGRDDGLFHGTAAESQAFPIMLTPSQSQFAYDALVQRAKCDSNSDTLACLRKLSATELQAINTNVAFPGGAGSPPLYMYSPTLDGDFITDYTYSAFAQGKFVRVPAIYGDDTNEGTIFAPRNTNTQASAHTFLKNQFPDLTDDQLSQLDSLYPVADYPSPSGAGKWWQQLAAVYGDMRYICPGLFLSNTYGKKMVPNWNYLWNVLPKSPDTDGVGVYHTVDVAAVWGSDYVGGPASYGPGGANYDVSKRFQAYFISFIRSLNPNTHRAPGAPNWDPVLGANPFTRSFATRRNLFESDQTAMNGVSDSQLDKCRYLWSIGVSLKQ